MAIYHLTNAIHQIIVMNEIYIFFPIGLVDSILYLSHLAYSTTCFALVRLGRNQTLAGPNETPNVSNMNMNLFANK